MPAMKPRPPQALLLSHLRRTGTPARAFAALAGLDPSQICRLISGERHPSLYTAFAIEDASGGDVPARSWLVQAPGRRIA